jgi:hypothetical protein
MYVRIARFDGGVGGDIQAEIDLMRSEFDKVRRGEQSDYLPIGLVDATDRVEVLADRASGSVVVLVYCRSEEQAREADRILSGMSPSNAGWGQRTSAGVFEVALDETTRAARAA